MKVTPFSLKKTLNLRGKLYDLSQPMIMGILNVTPDSFFDGNQYNTKESATTRLEQMINEGVDIIDIGGYSTRPGAEDISIQQEMDRVLPVIEIVRSFYPDTPISIDTFRSEVAAKALAIGVDMINDISGGNLDSSMHQLVAEQQIPYVLMHMRGNPQTMSGKTNYNHLIVDMMKYFAEKLVILKKLGITDVIADPGFGFAKTREQNFQLLRNLSSFQELGVPIMVGLSRKSMIHKTLEITAEEALPGTTALNTIALMNGASILRVHDIKAAHHTIRLFKETYP